MVSWLAFHLVLYDLQLLFKDLANYFYKNINQGAHRCYLM